MKNQFIKIHSRFSDTQRSITPAVWEHMQRSGRSRNWYVIDEGEKHPVEMPFEEETIEIKPMPTPDQVENEIKTPKKRKKQIKPTDETD